MRKIKANRVLLKVIAFAVTAILALTCLSFQFASPAIVKASNSNHRNVEPRKDYAPVAEMLEPFIEHEMADKDLPAVSIALVDGQQVVWAKGFGFADPAAKIPATAETVYRVGSVSKLFTDIAVMQLVEKGKLDLDLPVTRYLPSFQPRNSFGAPITLRQLMSHRSGLVREPPVGNYFDPTGAPLAKTIASLNRTKIVYPPGSRTKYSNAAIATVGYVLERSQNAPFAKYLKQAVLDPLGLDHSSFEPTPQVKQHLAKAFMWTLDGRVFPAPTFELGISPAGSMYTTVIDLGRFMSALFAGGRGSRGQVLKQSTLDQMWTPQYANAGQTTGYGIGFNISDLDGHRKIGHGGAIYGFATQLSMLPDDKLGAIVVTTKDAANSVTTRIADLALKAMLAVRQNKPVQQPETTSPIDRDLANRVAGRYVNGGRGFDLVKSSAGKLSLLSTDGGFSAELRSTGDALIADGKLAYGTKVIPRDTSVVIGSKTFERVATAKPEPTPEKWKGLVGEYGWDHDILYILEKDGRLWALIEWFEYDPLAQVSENVFKFPDHGLYAGEELVFTRNKNGKATEVNAANVVFKRRDVGPEGTGQLHIKPVRPVPELLKEALAAQPPKEVGEFRKPDLVEITRLDPAIKLDIRYASTNNFLGSVFYSQPRAFMQRPAAEAVVRVNQKLRKQGYGLLIHDAYRPWYVTKVFWEATPDDKKIFVADPSKGSRHNRGMAVDLTLYDLKTGEPIEMVGTYDETSDRSYPDYPGGTSLQRWHRTLLREAMESEGFTVYEAEWWHFDYKDWRHYPIGNATFENLGAGER
jgi:CubicO group peptidase (beta-lactamase class C family)/D-alanyl-D-alanine dipeptidase